MLFEYLCVTVEDRYKKADTVKFFRPLNKIPEDMASAGVLNFSSNSHFLVWINSWQWDHQAVLWPSL